MIYPRVVSVSLIDREKGIYKVSFFRRPKSKQATWGVIAKDELDAWQRVQQEFRLREEGARGRKPNSRKARSGGSGRNV